jgi:hypothetical protein
MALESLIPQPDDRVLWGRGREAPRNSRRSDIVGSHRDLDCLIGSGASHSGPGFVRNRGEVAQEYRQG